MAVTKSLQIRSDEGYAPYDPDVNGTDLTNVFVQVQIDNRPLFYIPAGWSVDDINNTIDSEIARAAADDSNQAQISALTNLIQ